MARGALWVLGALLALAVGLLGYRQLAARQPGARVLVRGGDGGGLPIAPPSDEHFNAAALARIATDPAAAGLQALLVTRDGHVVLARYGHGIDADTRIDSGGFARVLVALTAGIAAQQRALAPTALHGFDPDRLRAAIEQGVHQPYAQFLSRRLWSRLNAADAWIELPAAGAPVPADCCFQARLQDWLRVGGLLVNDGNFEGTAVLEPGWVARMRRPYSQDAEQGMGVALPSRRAGAPVYEANDVFLLRGPGRWRLWLVPSLRLVVLFGAPSAAGGAWNEARLPNLVMEALTDRPASQRAQSLLQQLVPGH